MKDEITLADIGGDLTVDTVGFILSEGAGIGAGVIFSGTGPGAIAAKLIFDIGAGFGWEIFSDAINLRGKVVNIYKGKNQ